MLLIAALHLLQKIFHCGLRMAFSDLAQQLSVLAAKGGDHRFMLFCCPGNAPVGMDVGCAHRIQYLLLVKQHAGLAVAVKADDDIMELAVERRVCAARLDSFADKLDHFAVYFMKPVAGFVSYGVDRVERDEHFQIAVYLIDIAGMRQS